MTTPRSANTLLTNADAADILGIKPNTLENWRIKGKGPRFVKLGKQKQAPIRYDEREIVAWLEAQCFTSTSAYPIESPKAIEFRLTTGAEKI